MRIRKSFTRLIALLLPLLAFHAAPDGAAGQTATNLECRGCVGKRDLGKNAVRRQHILKNAVRSGKIRDNTIRSRDIRNGAVNPADLGDAAKPAGVDYALGTSYNALTTSTQAIVSTTVNAPVAGFVVVFANWSYWTQAAQAQGFCSLNTEPDQSAQPSSRTQADDPVGYIHYDAASLTWTFPVSAGNTTFYLNCVRNGPSMIVINPAITALFVPNRY